MLFRSKTNKVSITRKYKISKFTEVIIGVSMRLPPSFGEAAFCLHLIHVTYLVSSMLREASPLADCGPMSAVK